MAPADSLKRDIAVACRILAANGHGDSVYGHVSGRLPGSERFWMKPGSIGMDETTAEQLIELDLSGNRLSGEGQPHREWPIHASIFATRPDVTAVVHTHPRFSVALAASDETLAMLSQDSFVFHTGVPVFTAFAHLIETPSDGHTVAAALGRSRALLIRGHGIVVVGEDVARATVGALMLERASEVQLLAGRGQPAARSDAESVADVRLAGARTVFEYHARRLGVNEVLP